VPVELIELPPALSVQTYQLSNIAVTCHVQPRIQPHAACNHQNRTHSEPSTLLKFNTLLL
jgi:hypothetical protein